MIAIVHSIYSQSVHALALIAGTMDNDAERYCTNKKHILCLYALLPGKIHKVLHCKHS